MIRVVNATTARCEVCGAVMRASQPWQLHPLAARHVAESHRTPATTPPWPAGRPRTG